MEKICVLTFNPAARVNREKKNILILEFTIKCCCRKLRSVLTGGLRNTDQQQHNTPLHRHRSYVEQNAPYTVRTHTHTLAVELTFLKPISLAYSRKHCRQMFRPYFRIIPWLLEQARLKRTETESWLQSCYIAASLSTASHNMAKRQYTCTGMGTGRKHPFRPRNRPKNDFHSPETRALSVFTRMRVPQVGETHFFD